MSAFFVLLLSANIFQAFPLHSFRCRIQTTKSTELFSSRNGNDGRTVEPSDDIEPMFSISYDPLEPPNQVTSERDLEDHLMERALRFYDKSTMRIKETCYLVGLEDRSESDSSDVSKFTLEESLTELSELAGAAGLTVIGSTYQRLHKPSPEYYIGQGKTKDIAKSMSRLSCTCVIFDTELTPSQQKNLELVLNQDLKKDSKKQIKVIDRTALILDIFAQHARTSEGQLQVQLAMLSYRLPRLTNMWSHLERQAAGSRGRSNGGVGLRGPGEKQLESDRRQMKHKISVLNRAIDAVRRHRSMHRRRRRQMGVPVVALVGYTNSGKSTLLNAFASADVLTADMLFATLDPTTRLVGMPGQQFPDVLMTDTVGFIQKLPTNLVAAFRATLEEITEADVLVHVADISNEAWRKQEASVLRELDRMGLSDKPLVTVWNKLDLARDRASWLQFEAAKRPGTVAVSAATGEGLGGLARALQAAIVSQMDYISAVLAYEHATVLAELYSLGALDEVTYQDDGIFIRGRVPSFLKDQILSLNDLPPEGYSREAEGEGADGAGGPGRRQGVGYDRLREWIEMGLGDDEGAAGLGLGLGLQGGLGLGLQGGLEALLQQAEQEEQEEQDRLDRERSTDSYGWPPVGGGAVAGSRGLEKAAVDAGRVGKRKLTQQISRSVASATMSTTRSRGRRDTAEWWEPEEEDMAALGLCAEGLLDFDNGDEWGVDPREARGGAGEVAATTATA